MTKTSPAPRPGDEARRGSLPSIGFGERLELAKLQHEVTVLRRECCQRRHINRTQREYIDDLEELLRPLGLL